MIVDRQSAKPNRFKVTTDDGSSYYVTLERADEPTVEGTPLNAATLNPLFEMAEEAHTNANAAKNSASTAQTTADQAKSAAATAQTTADEAKTAAATAQTAANATVPMTRGGTGASSGATGLKNLLAAGNTILSSKQYGTTLPSAGTAGRIFFKVVG